MNITMYGIPNCNTIKKARDWLTAQNIPYHFHDYKKQGLEKDMLQSWCDTVGWKVLLNQRGTTWRKLSVEDKADLNASKAIELMLIYPSMIKRPVLQDMDHKALVLVGFEEEKYAAFFKAHS